MGEGFLCHKASLRHRPFDGIHQQQHRIDHREHAFNFPAKIGMPGSIDNIDAVVIPVQGGIFGEYGNAALFLEFIGVHDPFDFTKAFAESTRLLQQFIHQSGFAMVDVGNDGDIA